MHGAAILVAMSLAQVPEPPPAVDIAWQAPPGCPDRLALHHAIADRLARSPAAGAVTVSGRITRHASGPRYRLRLRLVVRDRSDARELSANQCPPLADATALLVALMLDDAAASESAAPLELPAPAEPASPPETPPETPVFETMTSETAVAPAKGPAQFVAPISFAPGDPDLARTPARPPTPRAGWLLRAHAGPEYGALPGLTGALGLATGVLWPRARLELHATFLAPRTATRDAGLVHVLVAAGAALGCARPRARPLEFPLCGGLEFGAMRGDARGPGARTVAGAWLAGVVSAGAAWHVAPRWSLSIALQGLLRLYGPRFELREPGPAVPLFEPAVVSGRLLVGVELRLGDPT